MKLPSTRAIALFILCLFSKSFVARAELPAARVDLAGIVQDLNGDPISGATVIIWTAGVKSGYSIYCPGCYADCGKQAVTDRYGSFEIHRLDPELKFRLLILREGFAPTFVANVDPLKGNVTAELPARKMPKNPAQLVLGRVVDADGRPVWGALVQPEGIRFTKSDGSEVWGAIDGLDPMAVTNENGEFALAFAKRAESMTLLVTARGMAPKRFQDLATGEKRHVLPISVGATIRGRLTHKGEPVAQAEMGIVSASRDMRNHYREERIGIQRDGTFIFSNLPTKTDWYVYPKMDSVKQYGAAKAIACKTQLDDEIVDIGSIDIQPGNRLSGRVVLTDRKTISEGTRIIVGGIRAWDDQTSVLTSDGRFEFLNIPPDDYSINVGVKGYHVSARNPNLGWRSVVGAIDRDLDDFVILLEPGESTSAGRPPGQSLGKPLQSAPMR